MRLVDYFYLWKFNMKRLVLISVAFILNGCDVESHFSDKKIKVSGYICEAVTSLRFERRVGETEFKKKSNELKSNNKTKSVNFYFTLTEYVASNFSKNRNRGEVYYEFRRIENSNIRESLTINVWPKKEDGFTDINAIKNGYDAYSKKDGKTLHRNTEQVYVSDAIVKATMWDNFADLDTFLKRASSPEVADKLKERYKDVIFPLEDYEDFKLNRISGKFFFVKTRYLGEEKTPNTRQAESMIYSGQCKAGLNL